MHVRRAAEECVGGGDHAPDAHGDQPVQAAGVRLDDLVDDICSVGWGSPVSEGGPWYSAAQPAPERVSLRARRGIVSQRGERAAVGPGDDGMSRLRSLLAAHVASLAAIRVADTCAERLSPRDQPMRSKSN